jgi:hypothetical protein
MEATAHMKKVDRDLTVALLGFFQELHNPKPNRKRILYF